MGARGPNQGKMIGRRPEGLFCRQKARWLMKRTGLCLGLKMGDVADVQVEVWPSPGRSGW